MQKNEENKEQYLESTIIRDDDHQIGASAGYL